MKKLGVGITAAINEMGGNTEQARINMRAIQVRARYRESLEAVYREKAQIFLDHTNNVYIMNKDSVRTLIVYVDESIFAAELNAQRELIKLKLLELFGEEIEEFEIHISRGKYKKLHPYREPERSATQQQQPSVPLTADEQHYVTETASRIEDEKLRKALEKAMKADMEWKKAESEKI